MILFHARSMLLQAKYAAIKRELTLFDPLKNFANAKQRITQSFFIHAHAVYQKWKLRMKANPDINLVIDEREMDRTMELLRIACRVPFGPELRNVRDKLAELQRLDRIFHGIYGGPAIDLDMEGLPAGGTRETRIIQKRTYLLCEALAAVAALNRNSLGQIGGSHAPA